MTSSQAVRPAKIDAELTMARKVGDIGRMQQLAGQHQRVLESIYGALLAR